MRKIFTPLFLLITAFQGFSQSQFASSVIAFSTQWSPTSWSAAQTLGAPNTPNCGDITTAWASASADGAREFLVLGYTTPQPVNKINIYETYNPGAVDTIYLRNASNGVWNVVYTNTAASATPCPRTNGINITQTPYNVNAIRIAINSPVVPSWNEIDAVEIQNNCSTTITTSNNPLACFGNCNATATAIPNGQSPYTFSWTTSPSQTSATATGLCAGTYSVFVTDANACVSTASVTITQPTQLTISTSFTQPTCNGGNNGTATANVSGGTPNYIYQWSPTGGSGALASGLSAGCYTVLVTDMNGCTAFSQVCVTQPTPVTFSTMQTNVNCFGNCNGDAMVMSPTGGCGGPYTYLWSTGPTTSNVTGLCAGTYTVIVTDNCGCSNGGSLVTITQPPALQVTFTGSPELCAGDCNGQMNAIVAGGCPGYSYLWSNGQTSALSTNLCSATYSVTVTDQCGCSITQSQNLVGPAPLQPNVTFNNVSCSNCCDGSATSATQGGVAPYTYLWTPGNYTTGTISNLCQGNYTVCITDANNCTTCDTITISFPMNVQSNTSDAEILIMPNPSSGQFTVVLNGNSPVMQKAEIYDALGKLVFATTKTSIDISDQPKGVYLLKVYTNSGVLQRKIVLQ